jgi:hypothetical protein
MAGEMVPAGSVELPTALTSGELGEGAGAKSRAVVALFGLYRLARLYSPPKNSSAQKAGKTRRERQEVSGHGFSRAANGPPQNPGLQPPRHVSRILDRNSKL